MTAAIHYKWKSQLSKSWETITFEATVISVIDLKRAICKAKKLDKSNDDFDLMITNAQTGEQYRDDGFHIPKNTSVIVMRIPASSKQRSLTIKSEPTIKIIGDAGQASGAQKSESQSSGASAEDQKIAELIKQSAPMDQNAGQLRGRAGVAAAPRMMNRSQFSAPPPTYICHRCNLSGHWIQQCPTNGDPTFNYKKAMPATGIPRSFLQKVDASDESIKGSGALRLGDSLALARPNESAFEQAIASQRPNGSLNNHTVEKFDSTLKEYTCRLCNNLMKDPVVTPCCFTNFCDECIRQQLVADGTYTCPRCHESGVNPDSLSKNKRLAIMIEEFKASSSHDLASQNLSTNLEQSPQSRSSPKIEESIRTDSPVNVAEISRPGETKRSPPSASSVAKTNSGPERSPFCGLCGEEGHLSAACPSRASVPHPMNFRSRGEMQQFPMMMPPGHPYSLPGMPPHAFPPHPFAGMYGAPYPPHQMPTFSGYPPSLPSRFEKPSDSKHRDTSAIKSEISRKRDREDRISESRDRKRLSSDEPKSRTSRRERSRSRTRDKDSRNRARDDEKSRSRARDKERSRSRARDKERSRKTEGGKERREKVEGEKEKHKEREKERKSHSKSDKDRSRVDKESSHSSRSREDRKRDRSPHKSRDNEKSSRRSSDRERSSRSSKDDHEKSDRRSRRH